MQQNLQTIDLQHINYYLDEKRIKFSCLKLPSIPTFSYVWTCLKCLLSGTSTTSNVLSHHHASFLIRKSPISIQSFLRCSRSKASWLPCLIFLTSHLQSHFPVRQFFTTQIVSKTFTNNLFLPPPSYHIKSKGFLFTSEFFFPPVRLKVPFILFFSFSLDLLGTSQLPIRKKGTAFNMLPESSIF